MRTTLDLPQGLIEEAMSVSHFKTKTALIIRALEEFVRQNKIAKIKQYKGQVDLDIDLNALRDRS
ncbi:MAG: type II toxin-antitoxin system VapB family antitoxin [Phycisphaerae bacterium]|jgi:hypothetical protein|nr:type II toxin-antitoxin system VapB family antitoxin [Phycisphaerae bacterium]